MEVFNSLWFEFTKLPEITAIVLGGSRSGNNYDRSSDYDLYIYCGNIPNKDVRKLILGKYCSYIELENQFWEVEDNCTLSNGIDLDIIYRNINDFENIIENVVEKHQANNGYTTCFLHNLINSKVLYDPHKEFYRIKERFSVPFSKELKENIISKNFRLLTGNLPSYDKQIIKAFDRGDFVSVNHRIAAFIESYFDIIFAINELTHPGEKRMILYAKEHSKILPKDFEENMNELLSSIGSNINDVENNLKTIIKNLEDII